jgi:hypothetical protein
LDREVFVDGRILALGSVAALAGICAIKGRGSLSTGSDYAYFVIQRTPGMPSRPFKHESDVVVSGWEYEEDAKDDLKAWADQCHEGLKVYTRAAMKMVGYDIDPANFGVPA